MKVTLTPIVKTSGGDLKFCVVFKDDSMTSKQRLAQHWKYMFAHIVKDEDIKVAVEKNKYYDSEE